MVLPLIDKVLPFQKARKYDQAAMQVDGNPNAFRAPVCVLCDRLIIGCESVHKISREQLLSQSSRVSVKSYEDYHQVILKEELVSQYHIDGLEGLLLSPRAKESNTTDEGVAYDACSQCSTSWATNNSDLPPKHAIANGFAIGHIPDNIAKNEDITEQMSALLAPVQAFAYIFF